LMCCLATEITAVLRTSCLRLSIWTALTMHYLAGRP
jgi:hypothetical protein